MIDSNSMQPVMNIATAQVGTKVRYTNPGNGTLLQQQLTQSTLQYLDVYTITSIRIYNFESYITLDGFNEQRFNTVMFSDIRNDIEWKPNSCHPSHELKFSYDSSWYDEKCMLCGETDISGGGWGKLAEPCKGKHSHNDSLLDTISSIYEERTIETVYQIHKIEDDKKSCIIYTGTDKEIVIKQFNNWVTQNTNEKYDLVEATRSINTKVKSISHEVGSNYVR